MWSNAILEPKHAEVQLKRLGETEISLNAFNEQTNELKSRNYLNVFNDSATNFNGLLENTSNKPLSLYSKK